MNGDFKVNNHSKHFSIITAINVNHSCEMMEMFLTSIEEITQLQLELSKKIVENNAAVIKKSISINESRDILEFMGKIAEHSIENNCNNLREMFEIMHKYQNLGVRMLANAAETSVLNAQDRMARLHSAAKY